MDKKNKCHIWIKKILLYFYVTINRDQIKRSWKLSVVSQVPTCFLLKYPKHVYNRKGAFKCFECQNRRVRHWNYSVCSWLWNGPVDMGQNTSFGSCFKLPSCYVWLGFCWNCEGSEPLWPSQVFLCGSFCWWLDHSAEWDGPQSCHFCWPLHVGHHWLHCLCQKTSTLQDPYSRWCFPKVSSSFL